MAYIEDIRSRFGDPDALSSRYEITLIDDSRALISGQKGLQIISNEEVVVRVKGGKVRVYGEKLVVRSASREEVFVSGSIQGVEKLYEA